MVLGMSVEHMYMHWTWIFLLMRQIDIFVKRFWEAIFEFYKMTFFFILNLAPIMWLLYQLFNIILLVDMVSVFPT